MDAEKNFFKENFLVLIRVFRVHPRPILKKYMKESIYESRFDLFDHVDVRTVHRH